MSNTLRDLVASSFKHGKEGLGVLDDHQALQYFAAHGERSLVTIGSHKHNVFFFSDDHHFGYGVLPDDFVACTGGFPTKCEPRESIPNGVVDTLEKYIALFHEGERQITSIEELVELLDGLSPKEETPQIDYELLFKETMTHLKSVYGTRNTFESEVSKVLCEYMATGLIRSPEIVRLHNQAGNFINEYSRYAD